MKSPQNASNHSVRFRNRVSCLVGSYFSKQVLGQIVFKLDAAAREKYYTLSVRVGVTLRLTSMARTHRA